VVALLSNKDSATEEEREDIEDLREDYKQTEQLIKEASTKSSTARVGRAVASLLSKLEAEVAQVDKTIGRKLNLLDKDGDGVISEQELRDVVGRVMHKKLDDDQVKYMMKLMDMDGDGKIVVREVEALADLLLRQKEEMIEDEDDLSEDLKKAKEAISIPVEQMSDEQAVLFGSMLEEYRDLVSRAVEFKK